MPDTEMTRASHRLDHWDDHARQWSLIASPLRPHDEDVARLRQALDGAAGLRLLLGVTPEYARLFERVLAVDRSEAMIRALWPRDTRGKDAILGDWLHLPLRAECCDACIGDGCVNIFSYPLQYGLFFREVRRVLKPGGRFALRVFVRPVAGETCDAVCAHALQAEIGSFHAFKWRLAMAISAESGDANVRVGDILECFDRLLPDRARLAAASGWSLRDIGTINAYRNAPASYSFPTLEQLRDTIPAGFTTVEINCGTYELAQCCPMLQLDRVK